MWFGLVEFYGISTIVGYLMPNTLNTFMLNIHDWFGWVLWHINHGLFNTKSCLYIYIEYILFVNKFFLFVTIFTQAKAHLFLHK